MERKEIGEKRGNRAHLRGKDDGADERKTGGGGGRKGFDAVEGGGAGSRERVCERKMW